MPLKQVGQTPVDVYRAPAYNQPARTVVIHNADTANLVYYDREIGTIDSKSTFIEPLGTEVFDGTDDVWMSTLNSSVDVTVQVKIGSRSYAGGQIAIQGNVNATVTGNVVVTNTPAVTISGTPNVTLTGTNDVTIAGQVSALDVSAATVNVDGVAGIFPLGSNAVTGTILGNTSIAASTTATTGIMDMLNYTSFDITGGIYCLSQSSAGAPLTAEITLIWTLDAAGNSVVATSTGQIWVANAQVKTTNVTINGPCHARYLQVIVNNISSNTAMVTGPGGWSVFGTGRVLPDLNWYQIPPYGSISSGITSFTASGAESPDLPAALINVTLPATSTMWYPLCLVNKTVSLRLQTSVLLNKDPVIAVADNLVNGGLVSGPNALYTIWNPGNVATNDMTTTLELPPQPCYLVVNSTSTPAGISLVATTRGV